jgi:quinol monooxygenase YgiN
MILVTGRVQVPSEHRDRFVATATEMCSASRAEEGCIGYRIYEDLEQPGRYVFIEEWQDDEALQRHFAEPHTAKLMGALPGLLGEAPDALFHTVLATRRLDPARGLVALD